MGVVQPSPFAVYLAYPCFLVLITAKYINYTKTNSMAETLELALLGNPEVRLAGQPLTRFRSVKVSALLYYLATTRRPQPRTVLAGLFWGDVDEYYARRNFSRTLSDLAQFVGDHLLIERQTVAFARNQPYSLDVESVDNAATLLPTPQSIAMLTTAVNCYRGDFLDGFYVQDAPAFEQWVLTERTRLRTGALQLLQRLAHYFTEQGELTQAMNYARRILQLELWHEEAHRQLMLLLAQSGQRSAALAQFELCRQSLHSELAVEPDATTLALVAQIRAGGFDKVTGDKAVLRPAADAHGAGSVTQSPNHPITPSPLPLVTRSPCHNLPPQRTPFVGRAMELGEITRLLVAEDDCRLLTLIGPGGMGKTRLALRAAEEIVAAPAFQARFGDGIFFVPLENVSDGNGLLTAVISVITAETTFPHQGNAPPVEQLARFLRPKAILLLLDNFEHLVKEATLLSDLLLAAPKVKLLVTTRESLGLQEAWSYPVTGLTIPSASPEEPTAAPTEYDAVRLFVQCARRTKPGFVLEAEQAAVLRICALVEGMPLGIELAAAWLKVMTCAQIAQEVARGLDILTARYQNIPPRQRSMRVVMAHSWALLTVDERLALARLAIFRGQFRQEAANAIAAISLFTLAALVEKALVRLTPAGHYQLHELTRQYAEEQSSAADKAAWCDAHALYYADLLHQQKGHLFTSTFRQAWTTMSGELDNIRHAWQWLIEAAGAGRDDLSLPGLLRQMVEMLTAYHLYHLLWLPGQALFDHACQVLTAAGWADSSDDPPGQPSRCATLLRLQISAGQFQIEMGHYRASLALAEQVLPACRTFGLEDDLFRALLLYGHTQVRRGARTAAIPAFQEALALAEQLPSPRYRAEALIGLGMIASGEGRYAEAQDYYRQGLALCQTLGYRPWTARILTNLGTTYSRLDDPHQAQAHFAEAIKLAQEEGDQFTVMINTTNLGGVQRSLRNYQSALDYHQRSLRMARDMGEERWSATNLNGLADTYLGLANPVAAEGALHEALTVGHRLDSKPDTLNSVGLMGQLLARRGQVEAALKALLFVEQHPATLARDKANNQLLLAELRSELPAALVEQAEGWVAGQTLDDVVRWLLHGAV